MLDYILSHDATVPVCLCLAIVSGLPQCGKTISLKKMLHNSIELKHRKHFSPFLDQPMQFKVNEESLSSYDLCVLGTSPLETLAWMFSTKRYGVTMCLLSYFVRLCTHRNIPCDQLQFISSPATIPDPLLNEHVKWLFEKLQQRWKTVAKEAPKRFVLQTGICLLNVFDVGPSKAMYEFLPFLNRYCKSAMNLVCYSAHRDANKLHKPLDESECGAHLIYPNQPRVKQMFQGIANSGTTPVVFIASRSSPSFDATLENTGNALQGNTEAMQYLERLAKEEGIKIEHLEFFQQGESRNVKHVLEAMIVKDMQFFKTMPLRYMLLRSVLDSESPASLWKTREELERLSLVYNFQNGDMDNFLKLFSSYGSILYFHDIPSLRNYIVTNVWQFTQLLHELYYSKEETASKFGLLKQRDSEDWEMIFRFLIHLQIAVEVSPNEVIFESSHIPIDHNGLYYYLPSARCMPPENIPSNESIYISVSPTYIPGNMQARLVQYLLKASRCMLVPTQPINSTTVQFIADDYATSKVYVKIVNYGDKIELQLANTTTAIVHSLEQQIEVCKKVIEACCYALDAIAENIKYAFSIRCAEGNNYHDCNKEIDCDKCIDLNPQRQHWIDAYKYVSAYAMYYNSVSIMKIYIIN